LWQKRKHENGKGIGKSESESEGNEMFEEVEKKKEMLEMHKNEVAKEDPNFIDFSGNLRFCRLN
jgi:hypothetical protein